MVRCSKQSKYSAFLQHYYHWNTINKEASFIDIIFVQDRAIMFLKTA